MTKGQNCAVDKVERGTKLSIGHLVAVKEQGHPLPP